MKALYRRAEAYLGTQDFIEAIADLKRAKDIDPANRDVVSKLKQAKHMQSESDKKQAKLFGNMFERMAKMEAKEKVSQAKTDDKENVTPMETDEKGQQDMVTLDKPQAAESAMEVTAAA